MVSEKKYSSIFSIVFNRVLTVLITMIPFAFCILYFKDTFNANKLVLGFVLSFVLFVIMFITSLYFNIKLKYLSYIGGDFYIGYLKRKRVTDLKICKLIKGNTPFLVFNYQINGSFKKSITILKLFRVQKIYRELLKLTDYKNISITK